MPSVYIKTFGCQMNERDSEAVSAQLVAKGYSLATSDGIADVVLINTCSVRDLAEQKALRKMSNVIGVARKANPGQIFGFMGCMAQSRGQELIDQLPDLDLVIGTQKFHRAAEYLDDLLSGRRAKIVDVAEEPESEARIREHILAGPGKKAVTAFVSIMQGCNQHCTFCIVPATRGEERSRSIPDVVAECRELAGQGVKEITLLGQIVTSFGRREKPSADGRSAFVRLLDAVQASDGLERIRFTSPHPKGYGDDLIEAYGRWPKLVDSAHIPVQSGSDSVLKRMHRGYSRARFIGIVEKLRKVRPQIGLSTDLIVGFPGETEADFEETLSLCREVEFDQAFIFKYSPRRDTPAATMPDPLSTEVKAERHQQLLTLVNTIASRRYQSFVGKLVEILVEGQSERGAERWMGRTRCNRIVLFDGSERHRGQLMNVRVTRTGSFTLYADPAILE